MISPSSGFVGATVTAHGSGFGAGELVQGSFGGAPLSLQSCSEGTLSPLGSNVQTTPYGAFACAFAVPASPHGDHNILWSSPAASNSSSGNLTGASNFGVLGSFSVGNGPWGEAYDPANGEIFVADIDDGQVTVVNDSTGAVLASVPVGSRPHGVAYDPADGNVYVTNYDPGGPGSVSVLNATNDTVVATIPVGLDPLEVAYDPLHGEIFSTNFLSSSLSVISDVTHLVTTTIPLPGGPVGIVYDPATDQMFVATHDGNVTAVSDSNNSVVANVWVGDNPWGVAYDPAKGEVFATQNNGSLVAVISDTTDTMVGNVSVGLGLTGAAYDPVEGTVLVASLNMAGAGGNAGQGVSDPGIPGSLFAINDTTDRVVANISVGVNPTWIFYDPGTNVTYVTIQNGASLTLLGSGNVTASGAVPAGAGPWGMAYDPVQRELFVADLDSGTVSVLNDSNSRLVGNITVGSRPHGVAYDPADGNVYVTNYDPGGPGSVSVLNATNDTVVATIPVGLDPLEVAYDPLHGEIFSTNFLSSSLSVISDVTHLVTTTIPLPGGPVGIVYDPATDQMFVATHDGNVTVVSDSNNSVVANVWVGDNPWGVAYDPAKGEVFATQNNGSLVAVISDTTDTMVGNVSVGLGLTGAAYDPVEGTVLVASLNMAGAGGNAGQGVSDPGIPGSLFAINDTTDRVVANISVGVNPTWITYDPRSSAVFLTDQNDGTVTIFPPSTGGNASFGVESNLHVAPGSSGPPGSNVTFSGTGYAANSSISFAIGGVSATAAAGCRTASNGSFWNCTAVVPSNATGNMNVTATDGSGNVNANNVSINVTALAPRELVFAESGLVTGTPWEIVLTGKSPGLHIELAVPLATLTRSRLAPFPIDFNVSVGPYSYLAESTGFAIAQGNLTVGQQVPPLVEVSFVRPVQVAPGPVHHSSPAPAPSPTLPEWVGITFALLSAVGLIAVGLRVRTERRREARELVARLDRIADGKEPPPGL